MDNFPLNLLFSRVNSASSLSEICQSLWHQSSHKFPLSNPISAVCPSSVRPFSLSVPCSPWLLPSYFQPQSLSPLHCCFPAPIQPTLCWTDFPSLFTLSHRLSAKVFPILQVHLSFLFFTPFLWYGEITRLWRAQEHTLVSYPVLLSRWNLLLAIENNSSKVL